MQHYGAPTRLLDWTKSPWVAAFFAVSDGWQSDGYVFIFCRRRLEQRIRERFANELDPPGEKRLVWGPHPSGERFSDPDWDLATANERLFSPEVVGKLSEWVTTYYCREAHFPRLVAQQGLFTFASKSGVDHWKGISGLLDDDDCMEVQIAREAKPEILRRLNSVGLNGATLFPGADGIGKSLDGFARAWHLEPRPSQFGRGV
jgi:hypothetical protein